jgi:hypothetical protein
MDAQQRFLFDLQGFVVIKNAIAPALLRQLDEALDEAIAAECGDDSREQLQLPRPCRVEGVSDSVMLFSRPHAAMCCLLFVAQQTGSL